MLERLRRSGGTVREGQDRGCGTADKLLFHDENGVLRLAVRQEDLICIEAAGNYAVVRYASAGGRPVRQAVRCPLYRLETRFRGTSVVRCRRGCLVNMDRVRSLRKGEGGYVLELETGPVGVTRTYEKTVLEALGAI